MIARCYAGYGRSIFSAHVCMYYLLSVVTLLSVGNPGQRSSACYIPLGPPCFGTKGVIKSLGNNGMPRISGGSAGVLDLHTSPFIHFSTQGVPDGRRVAWRARTGLDESCCLYEDFCFIY